MLSVHNWGYMELEEMCSTWARGCMCEIGPVQVTANQGHNTMYG